MSFAGPINLPSPITRGGIHYTIKLLSTYLRALNPAAIRADVASHGYYLAKGENVNHENIALEKFKLKLNDVLSCEVEARKNSWVNSIHQNLDSGNDKAVASMIVSLWRRILGETSCKKAILSSYGYVLNGNQRAKTKREKEIKALCEYCHQEITVPLGKGFTCPICGVFFQDFRPQKIKLKAHEEPYYEESYNEVEELVQRIRKGKLSLEKTASKLKNAAQLSLF